MKIFLHLKQMFLFEWVAQMLIIRQIYHRTTNHPTKISAMHSCWIEKILIKLVHHMWCLCVISEKRSDLCLIKPRIRIIQRDTDARVQGIRRCCWCCCCVESRLTYIFTDLFRIIQIEQIISRVYWCHVNHHRNAKWNWFSERTA